MLNGGTTVSKTVGTESNIRAGLAEVDTLSQWASRRNGTVVMLGQHNLCIGRSLRVAGFDSLLRVSIGGEMTNAAASKTAYWGFDSLPMHMDDLMCCICFWIGVPEPEGMYVPDGKARTIIGGHAVCEEHAGYFQTPELAFFIKKHKEKLDG